MLTGGTGDVNPQYLSILASQSAADTTTTTQVQLPIQRLPTGGRAQVMELLKVFFTASSLPEVDSLLTIALSTSSFGTTAVTFSEPRVFALFSRQVILTTSGQAVADYPFTYDCTDGAGHGIIIATDSIYVQVASTTTGVANNARIKLMYRWKDVPLQEYIGVVQSQQ